MVWAANSQLRACSQCELILWVHCEVDERLQNELAAIKFSREFTMCYLWAQILHWEAGGLFMTLQLFEFMKVKFRKTEKKFLQI